MSNKSIILIILIFAIITSVVFFVNFYFLQKPDLPVNSTIKPIPEEPLQKPDPIEPDLSTKQGLLLAFQHAADEEDYENFAKYLKIAYEQKWIEDEDFVKVQSELYMKVTEKYFDTGDVDKALEISTIVYDEVSQLWRFRYLRIRCLEKLGRDAFDMGDLVTAEDYAMTILQMMFRLEGTNLLADVYIQKIEQDLANNDKQSAENNLYFIWDYEVSQNRRDKLNELKTQIGL